MWDSTTPQSSRVLGFQRSPFFHELERTQGGPTVFDRVPEVLEGQDGAVAFRQFNNHLLFEKTGFSEICSPARPLNGNSGILSQTLDCPSTRTSQGSSKRFSRPGLPSPPSCYRVVAGQGDVQLGNQSGVSFSSGSVRDKGEHTTSAVCFPLPRQFGTGGQRFQFRLESLDVHLPLSSHELPVRCGFTAPRVRRCGHPDSSLLAIEGVVPSTPTTVQTGASASSEVLLTESNDFEGFGSSQQSLFLEPVRLDSVSGPWRKDLSEDSVNIIRNTHRLSTIRQYQSIWKKFLNFLALNRISHRKVTVFVVMNFLSHHFVLLKRKYRTIAAYKCALALPLFVNFGIELSDARLALYMRGVFNSKPPCKSGPMPAWSLNSLLSFLSSDHFEPLSSKSLYIVTQKTLCLLLLASGRRIGEITHLSKKHTHHQQGNVVTICWLPNFIPKHCDSSFQPKFPSVERLDSNNIRDLWLCPVRALNTYLGMIGGGPRFSINSPLWSYKAKGLTKMLQTTVLQARQRMGDMALVPMGPHQFRKLAASYSAQMISSSSASEEKLMEKWAVLP